MSAPREYFNWPLAPRVGHHGKHQRQASKEERKYLGK